MTSENVIRTSGTKAPEAVQDNGELGMIQQWVDEKEVIREQHREGGSGTESKQHQCSAKVFRSSLGDTPRMVPSQRECRVVPTEVRAPTRLVRALTGPEPRGANREPGWQGSL